MKNDKLSGDAACKFIQNHLISVAEDGPTGVTFPGLRGHLDSCPECAALVRRFSEAWEDPDTSLGLEPSPDFFQGLIRRVEAEEGSYPGRPGVLANAWRLLRPATVTVLLLAGMFAGHELGKKRQPILAPEAVFADRVLQSFDSIPPGSVADFYVSRQRSGKEGLR